MDFYWTALAEKQTQISYFLPISFPTFSNGDEVFILDHRRLKMFTFGLDATSFSWLCVHQTLIFHIGKITDLSCRSLFFILSVKLS